tara:strand:+ start:6705 stop:6953 length:249 start_codon:yes stop_codon:yes gene_type:complete
MCFIDCKHGQYCPDDNVTYPCMECDDCTGKIDWLNQSLSMLLLEYSHEPNKFNFKLSNIKPNHGKHRLETTLVADEFDDLPF